LLEKRQFAASRGMPFGWGIEAKESKDQTLRMEPSRSPTSEFERTQQPCNWVDASIGTLEQLGYRVESALVRKPWVSVFVPVLVFLACTSVPAFRRRLWFDEILTEYIAALPSFGAIYKALAAHAESSPPLFHLVSKLSGTTLGWSALGLRFPAIAGYLAMILCVYFVVRRYTGPLYAAIGALSSYLTKAPYYSTEARPYGLLLGLSCIALVCWQLAARYRVRRLALAHLGKRRIAAERRRNIVTPRNTVNEAPGRCCLHLTPAEPRHDVYARR